MGGAARATHRAVGSCFLSSRRRHTRLQGDWSSDVCSSDLGTALVGTNTIDLYKPSRLEMKRWGARNVDIDILQWGSEEKSLQVLGPRMKHAQVQKMVASLQKRNPTTAARVASSAAQSSAKTPTSKQVAAKSSSRTLD